MVPYCWKGVSIFFVIGGYGSIIRGCACTLERVIFDNIITMCSHNELECINDAKSIAAGINVNIIIQLNVG